MDLWIGEIHSKYMIFFYFQKPNIEVIIIRESGIRETYKRGNIRVNVRKILLKMNLEPNNTVQSARTTKLFKHQHSSVNKKWKFEITDKDKNEANVKWWK